MLYDVTNEYADYDIDANEIARYDKKRRGQELLSAAEPIMNSSATM